MKKKAPDEIDDLPQIAASDLQQLEAEGADNGQPINLAHEGKEKFMPKEKLSCCPKCGGEKSMEILCRGKNQRLWACRSSKCAKGPLQMSLFFQMGNNVPVCFALNPGQMHAIEEYDTKENQITKTGESA